MEAPMSSSLGAMGPLLRKLDSLLDPDGSRLPKVLKNRIESLRMDLLEDILDPLVELSEVKAPDLTAKYWITEARELSYDIEDIIDEMIPPTVHSDAAAAPTRSGAKSHKCRVGSAKIVGIPRMLLKRNTRRIDKIAQVRMDLVWEAIDRHQRYVQLEEEDTSSNTFVFSAQPEAVNTSTAHPKMAPGSASSRRVSRHLKPSKHRSPLRQGTQKQEPQPADDPDPWQHKLVSPTRYGEASNLVGIDSARIELMNWINYEEKQDLKVVSIVGPGGIGKSTLAKELYQEQEGQFTCRAFVRASRKPNVRKLLWDVLAQIQRHHRPSRACKVQSLVDDISRHLQDKRYFIVIDDLWQTTIWDIVASAFPESNNSSRILITTEIEDTALNCCGYHSEYIFKMKPLCNADSKKIFVNIFGSELRQGHKEMNEVAYDITKKSGGLPLATTSVAGLARFLARQQTKQETWSHIQDFLSTTLTSFGIKEMMKETLHFCYDNIPQHLRTCLLYLSMYPEGYVISKEDLVKQWIAEGFICTTQGKDKEEIADSYFNELINCRLIHPNRIKYIDGVMSCTVHHMVLDMIKSKSKEANFTTVTDYPHIISGLSTKVRRLSLQLSSVKHATKPATVTMPQVRSIAFFGLLECLPPVATFKFKLLRVLVLEIWGEHCGRTSLDLTRICAFLQLRYVMITSDVTVQLPDEVKGLQLLETFKVDARVSSVPLDITDLRRLSQLRIKDEVKLPNGIGRIRSLYILQYFDIAQNSEKNVQSLGELSNLKEIHLTCSTARSDEILKRNLDALSCSLGKLNNLCSLTLAPGASGAGRIPLEGPMTVSSVPVSIQTLKLLPQICIFSQLPEWIGELRKLRVLKIAVRELLRNDINRLGVLPALEVLSLHVRVARVGTVIIESGSFPALRYFQFRSTALSMAFRAGAMPILECLKLGFKGQTGKQYGRMIGGIEHLPNLKEITGEIAIATGAGESDRMDAQRAFFNAIEYSNQKWNAVSDEHPRFPKVHVKLADWAIVEEEGSRDRVTTTNRDLVCDKLPFPLDLLPAVISFTSPFDACRCSAVCTAFHEAASRDQVWDRFIPPDYRSILSRATDPVDVDFASTKKELFSSLADQHILIDEGNKIFWLERTTGAKSYMLAAKSLDITWGDTPQYWRWTGLPDSRFKEVAELVDVCWLDITANIDCRELSPNTRYAAYLVFNLTKRSYGLDSPSQEARITIAGTISASHTVSLYHHERHHWEDEEDQHNEYEETEDDKEDEEQDDIDVEEDEEKEKDDVDVTEEGENGEDKETDEEENNFKVDEEDDDEDEDQHNEYEETEDDEEDEEQDDIDVEEDEEKEDDDVDITEEGENGEDEEIDEEENNFEVDEEDDDEDEEDETGEEDEESPLRFPFSFTTAPGMQETPRRMRATSNPWDSHEDDQAEDNVRYPRQRGDGWMEVEMGEFCIENLDDGVIEIRLMEHETLNWKSGLIVEGVEIRPVTRSDKLATTC